MLISERSDSARFRSTHPPLCRWPVGGRRAGRRRRGPLILALGWGALLLLLLAGLAACGREAAPPPDPYAPYRPALKSDFQRDFERMDFAPRYALSITVGPALDILTGTATIHVPNYSDDTWRFLLFRLYPALSHYRSQIAIQSVSVNDQPTPYIYQDDNTSLRIDLVQPLPAGSAVDVRLNWKTTIPRWPDDNATYALFGRSQEMVSLPLFYPSLAVYGVDPSVGLGAWWQETGTARGDAAYNIASLFVVTATLPSEQVPVASGTQVESKVINDEQTQHVWVTGPVREFTLHMSPLFRSAETEAYGTRVVSYWLPGQEVAGRAALNHTAAALRIYSDYFGEYPYRDMRVAPAPINFRGMEYPQLILLGVDLYTRVQNNLEVLIAHEVAHQWWYLMVHNDPVNLPWLDEALAEYSVRLYYQYLYGTGSADLLVRQRWQTPYDLLVDRDLDAPINQPVDVFENGSQYETVIYGKGALFYTQLQQALGERQFRRFLRDYYQAHRYGVVDLAIWRDAMAAFQLPSVDALVREWIGTPPRPAEVNVPRATSAANAGEETAGN